MRVVIEVSQTRLGKILYKVEEKGSVYLASTKSELQKGWLKCGITQRDTKTRIAEGNVASIRERYELLFSVETLFFKQLEKHMHQSFENQKEWIYATLPEAISEINRFLSQRKNPNDGLIKKFTPKSHQKEAIDAVVNEFSKADKASIVLPTGSGKTLTSLWISEALNTKTVLFLAPSLQLIRQTKDAWMEQSREDFLWMACCSASDLDERVYAEELSGGMVTTDPAEIDGFVHHIKGKKVIFCTYQSLPAVINSGISIDLTIADEAHRTAGITKGEIGLYNLIHSENLKTRLRLFQTASPKVFKENLLDIIESEEKLFAFDMNDVSKYGNIVYEITLGDAIEKRLLCDYRIVAIGVNDKEIERHLKERTYVAKGVSADEVAAASAIIEIFKRTSVSHMISFHSRLSLAELTSKELNKSGLKSEPVKGTMSTALRDKIFKRFIKNKKGVLTNAFALQEGIDIKKVDSIFFSSPKSSTISIVQAIGRALRLDPSNPNKIALIVIPIYTSGEPNEEIAESSFNSLYQLISSISQIDYRVRAFVNGLSEGKGERGEPKPLDYVKIADFERLDFVNFSSRLRNAFVFGTLKRKRKSFDENLEIFKKYI